MIFLPEYHQIGEVTVRAIAVEVMNFHTLIQVPADERGGYEPVNHLVPAWPSRNSRITLVMLVRPVFVLGAQYASSSVE